MLSLLVAAALSFQEPRFTIVSPPTATYSVREHRLFRHRYRATIRRAPSYRHIRLGAPMAPMCELPIVPIDCLPPPDGPPPEPQSVPEPTPEKE